MNRRRFIIAATAFTLLSTTAARADYVEDIVKWLEKQGYTDIEVGRTLLGRARIRADKDGGQRELICNPRTGEILRDVWVDASGNIRPAGSSPPGTKHDDETDDNSGQSNTGGSGDGDDDGGDDDGGDDNSGDDNSGHGGGDDDENEGDDDNSGHGGSDDDDDDGGDDD